MARYIDENKLDELIENRKAKGDCKFCNKYERCIKNGINRKGSHLYCWEKIELPTADVEEVVRCKDCGHKVDYCGRLMCGRLKYEFKDGKMVCHSQCNKKLDQKGAEESIDFYIDLISGKIKPKEAPQLSPAKE